MGKIMCEGVSFWNRLARKNFTDKSLVSPRPISEISVWRRVPSWKLPTCSMIFEKGFLENRYLFLFDLL